MLSLPSRERGLKSDVTPTPDDPAIVAPLAGARIEIADQICAMIVYIVAPLAGARIEILQLIKERLKIFVAPLAGARIEIR